MNNKLEEAKNEMFANVEDPLKSRWWEVAWTTLHEAEFGPVISKTATAVEEALWLLELRNIHAVYEAVFFGWEYDPMWMDWWEATNLPIEDLATFLRNAGAFEEDEDESIPDAVHTYCWSKRQEVFAVLMKKFVDDTHLFLFFIGDKVPKGSSRDRERIQALCNWVGDALDY